RTNADHAGVTSSSTGQSGPRRTRPTSESLIGMSADREWQPAVQQPGPKRKEHQMCDTQIHIDQGLMIAAREDESGDARLVLADWLQERDSPLGEAVRLVEQLRRLDPEATSWARWGFGDDAIWMLDSIGDALCAA